MPVLVTDANLPAPDEFCEELIDLHRDLTDGACTRQAHASLPAEASGSRKVKSA